MRERNQILSFVKSLAGHDKDTIYVIIREEKEYVYVADGRYHTLDKLKKKNKKHIQWINYTDDVLDEKGARCDDVDIKRAIKIYKAKK